MGFLKDFFEDVFAEERTAISLPTTHADTPGGGFSTASEQEIEAHLQISRYGDFVLTDAVRPSYGLEVVPSAGYRHEVYRDAESKSEVPVIMAAASREHLIDTFMDLLRPLGPVVDVVLETSHGHRTGGHTDLYREHIDMPILESILWDFENLLTNDGCTGLAVLNPRTPQEVQLDEHKLLIVYGSDLSEYERILRGTGLRCREKMQFITEAEHVHSTTEQFVREFEELKIRLGMDGE
jgi:hypothetical protein